MTNKSILQPTKYQVSFSILPDLVYYCQVVNLPGISLQTITSPTPLANLKVPGNKPEFNQLNMNFLVDNELHSWLGIYNWITSLAPPKDSRQYRQLQNKVYSDASLLINRNDETPMLRVKFHDVFPTSLSGIEFTVHPGEEELLLAEAVFSFTTQEIEKVS